MVVRWFSVAARTRRPCACVPRRANSSAMATFLEALASGPLVVDGAMGSQLFERGVLYNACLEELNLTQARADPQGPRGLRSRGRERHRDEHVRRQRDAPRQARARVEGGPPQRGRRPARARGGGREGLRRRGNRSLGLLPRRGVAGRHREGAERARRAGARARRAPASMRSSSRRSVRRTSYASPSRAPSRRPAARCRSSRPPPSTSTTAWRTARPPPRSRGS